MEGFSERLINVVDMVNTFLYVAVDEVFTFNELYLSLAYVNEVFNNFPYNIESISDRAT